jgi:hypothetical protein
MLRCVNFDVAGTCDIGGFLPECFDISESMSEADAA